MDQGVGDSQHPRRCVLYSNDSYWGAHAFCGLTGVCGVESLDVCGFCRFLTLLPLHGQGHHWLIPLVVDSTLNPGSIRLPEISLFLRQSVLTCCPPTGGQTAEPREMMSVNSQGQQLTIHKDW